MSCSSQTQEVSTTKGEGSLDAALASRVQRAQPQKAAHLHPTSLYKARSGALTEMCAVARPATNVLLRTAAACAPVLAEHPLAWLPQHRRID